MRMRHLLFFVIAPFLVFDQSSGISLEITNSDQFTRNQASSSEILLKHSAISTMEQTATTETSNITNGTSMSTSHAGVTTGYTYFTSTGDQAVTTVGTTVSSATTEQQDTTGTISSTAVTNIDTTTETPKQTTNHVTVSTKSVTTSMAFPTTTQTNPKQSSFSGMSFVIGIVVGIIVTALSLLLVMAYFRRRQPYEKLSRNLSSPSINFLKD